MKHVLALAAVFAALAFNTACPKAPPAGEGEGEGEGAAGEGEGEGEGVAGEGEGEGVAGEGEGEGATAGCQTDADCNGGNAQSCQTIFSGAGTKGCFATCDTLTAACTTLTGGTGDCENFDATGTAAKICVEQAGDRQPCGDAANAACGDNTPNHEAVCVTLGDDPSTPQDEHQFSFCLVPCTTDADCVTPGEACSNDIHFSVGTGGPFGACAPASTANEACGVSATEATLCTGTGIKCTIPANANEGTCQ
jgi:hypothetical protein